MKALKMFWLKKWGSAWQLEMNVVTDRVRKKESEWAMSMSGKLLHTIDLWMENIRKRRRRPYTAFIGTEHVYVKMTKTKNKRILRISLFVYMKRVFLSYFHFCRCWIFVLNHRPHTANYCWLTIHSRLWMYTTTISSMLDI